MKINRENIETLRADIKSNNTGKKLDNYEHRGGLLVLFTLVQFVLFMFVFGFASFRQDTWLCVGAILGIAGVITELVLIASLGQIGNSLKQSLEKIGVDLDA